MVRFVCGMGYRFLGIDEAAFSQKSCLMSLVFGMKWCDARKIYMKLLGNELDLIMA